MFMKQATSDRLLGMLVTLATGAAILYIQHRIKVFVNRRKASGKGERSETKKATDYGDPYFRARWGRKSSGNGGIFELVHHIGTCMCGRFGFRLLAPAELKALDCPGRVRYPHVFVPVSSFQPLADLRLLTLFSARGGGLASHNVVVHAFCTSCGVPVFRASDGAIDTLVVNIECLRGESVKSLEVTYYEDLLGFPRDDVQEGVEGGGEGRPEQQQRAGSPTWGEGVGERGGGKGAWFGANAGGEGGGSRPADAATMSGSSSSDAGALVRATTAEWSRAGAGAEGGVCRWGGKMTSLVDAILPVRGLFAASGDGGLRGSSISSSNGCYGRPSSALMGRMGATSLLSHLLSRASLSTCPPSSSSRPLAIETCGHRGLGEEDDDDPCSGSNNSSSSDSRSPAWPTAGASASMWHAWDESCEVRRERGGRGRGGGGWWAGSGSSHKTPATSTITGLSVPVPGGVGGVGRGGGGGDIGGGSFYHKGMGGASGWERVSGGCTPPSMHQLRYHLKRHVKRRLSWLNGNGGGGGDGGMGGREDTGFPVDHYFHHLPQQENDHEEEYEGMAEKREEEEQHQQQQQHRAAITPPPSAAAAAAADSFSSPTTSTPLADTTNLQQQQQEQAQQPSTLSSRSSSDGVTVSKGSIPAAAAVAASNGMRKKQQPFREGGENRAPIAKGGKAD
ncbi:hypothetical protein VYU27_003081 [Nannochloropsis oceanica]